MKRSKHESRLEGAFDPQPGRVAFAISNRSGQTFIKPLIESVFCGILAINVNPDKRLYGRSITG